ncbi:MAG: hypothetical protein U0350_34170 [Caldilineaceae bacterium]
MGHVLLLELPEEIYQPLIKTAQQSGDTLEQVATNWLAAMVRQTWQDPLERFIGSFRSNVFDWADQHDLYLGQQLSQEMQGRSEVNLPHE